MLSDVDLSDSKNNVRNVQSLFAKQGASICDPRVQAKIAASNKPGVVVRDHLLNPIEQKMFLFFKSAVPLLFPTFFVIMPSM